MLQKSINSKNSNYDIIDIFLIHPYITGFLPCPNTQTLKELNNYVYRNKKKRHILDPSIKSLGLKVHNIVKCDRLMYISGSLKYSRISKDNGQL